MLMLNFIEAMIFFSKKKKTEFEIRKLILAKKTKILKFENVKRLFLSFFMLHYFKN